MKSIINRIFIASALTFSLSACSDFLNKEPLSQGTEAIVFKTPEHFEQAAYYLYDLYGWDYNAMDRNLDISGLGTVVVLLPKVVVAGVVLMAKSAIATSCWKRLKLMREIRMQYPML